MIYCSTTGCLNHQVQGTTMCEKCAITALTHITQERVGVSTLNRRPSGTSLSGLYPKYYKAIPIDWESIDVYGVHHLFKINDPSGMIQHASKKLLLSGVRTGGKSQIDDIREARDTLNRYLELNKAG